ncbi:MAG: hypothetical protein K2O16_07935 [Lachnospiraceae bacterium]|nr:hypothetical protein [Lachnospiraceae bacterium]
MIDEVLNKAAAVELFEGEAVLIGSDDAVPFYRAVELFGEWAAAFINECREKRAYFEIGRDYSGWGACNDERPFTEYFYKTGFLKLVQEHNYLHIIKAHNESRGGQLIDRYTEARLRRLDEREAEEERRRAERKAKRAAAKAARETAEKKGDKQV